MTNAVQSGVLRGRPYGGVAFLISKSLLNVMSIVATNDRFIAIAIGDMLLCNVYLPCAGTENRKFICEEILANIQILRSDFTSHEFVICGDLNTELDDDNDISKLLNSFFF